MERRQVRVAADRRIWALALPTLGALLVEPLYNLTDTAVVGHLGRVPLGGLAVATAILTVLVSGCGFLSMATAPRIAFLRAAGRPQDAIESARCGYWVATALGLTLAVAVASLASPLASIAGAHGAVHHAAVTYLRIAAAGMPFVLCIFAGNGHLRGLADTKTAFVVMLASNAVNVVAEIGLVYGLGVGLVGSAIGTVIAQVFGAAWFMIVSRSRVGVAWWTARPDPAELRRLVSAGGVLVIRTLALLAAWSGSTAIAARMGDVVLGGHQIALQVWFVVALSLDALAVPAQILVGEALGASGSIEAERVARTVLRVGLLVGIGLGAAMAVAAPFAPSLFTGDRSVAHAATLALLVGAVSLPLGAVAFELDGVLLGAGDLRFLRRTMLLALLGFAPVAAATALDHRLGVVGLWSALTCWLGARAGLLTYRWRSGRWLTAGDR
ncbi:MAG: MATE family efflux transporter [Acidimicrobiales bacterium]